MSVDKISTGYLTVNRRIKIDYLQFSDFYSYDARSQGRSLFCKYATTDFPFLYSIFLYGTRYPLQLPRVVHIPYNYSR